MRPLLLFFFFLLTACSDRITVRTDSDRTVRLTDYRSFKWLPVKDIESRNQPLIFNELNDRRIKNAVNAQMEQAGYKLYQENGELILHYHIIVEDRRVINPLPYGYSYGSYWIDRRTDYYYYREGTLIIDVMDASNKQLLWRGWAFSVLDEQPYLSEELLNECINRMFKKFPSLPEEDRF